MHEYDIVLGVDVGGTKTEVALIRFLSGKEFEVKKRVRRPTEREKGALHIVAVIADLCKEVVKDIPGGLNAVVGIGIGLPGTVDPKTKMMVNGNTQILIGVDVAHELKKALSFDRHINVANDANCFALAETLYGAGLKHAEKNKMPHKDLIGLGIILGTGVGGGLIVNGKIYEGANGVAAEIGHSFLKQSDSKCFCGEFGHAEQFLCGPAIEANFAKKSSKQMDAAQIFEISGKNSTEGAIALQVIDEYKKSLALFLANLCNLYDPHFIVLGGGVSLQKEIYQELVEQVRPHLFYKNSKIEIYQHVLGDSAGVIGAGLLA